MRPMLVLPFCIAFVMFSTPPVTAQDDWFWNEDANAADVRIFFHHGQEAYESGDYALARDYFEVALEMDSTSAELHRWLGHTLLRLGLDSVANAVALRCAALEPWNGDTDVLIGMIAYSAGEFERSDSAYVEAVRNGASEAFTYYRWHLTDRALGRHGPARWHLFAAMALAPENRMLVEYAIDACISARLFDSAEACARKGVALDRSSGEFMHSLGTILFFQGSWGEAAIWLKRAADASANPSVDYMCLAIVHEQLLDFSSAAAYRDSAFLTIENEALVQSWFGYYYGRIGEHHRSAYHHARALDCEETLDAYIGLAVACILAGREDDACIALSRLECSDRFREDAGALARAAGLRRYLPCNTGSDEISENGMAAR